MWRLQDCLGRVSFFFAVVKGWYLSSLYTAVEGSSFPGFLCGY